MHGFSDVFLSSLVTMFLVIDPIGNAAYFAVISAAQTRAQRLSTAMRANFVALVLVAMFILFGEGLLRALQVHLPSFQIDGGLFLLLIAIKMVLHDDDSHDEAIVGRDLAIFPMAIPLIAGPDTLSASLLLVSRDSHDGHTLVVFLGFVAVLVVSFVLMVAAGGMARLLGPSILAAVNKVIGMLLGAFSVEYIIEGGTAAMAIH